jgi:hypothetical protein
MNKMLGVPGRSFHLANGQHYRADDLGNIEVEIGDLAVMRSLRYVEPSHGSGGLGPTAIASVAPCSCQGQVCMPTFRRHDKKEAGYQL